MPYDPSLPAPDSPNSSAEMRGQLNSLKALIDAITVGGITGIVLDGVNIVNPGDPGGGSAQFVGGVLHLTLSIPRGTPGLDGSNGTDGADGTNGADGTDGTDGTNGTNGTNGINGVDGAPGGPGPQGVQGPPFANALVGGVSTLNPGDNASVTTAFDGTNVTFFFAIPRGADGMSGISQGTLDTAISGTSRNSNNVATLSQGADVAYNQSEIQSLMNKMDELINALRR